jgi:hypothetical protein
MLLCQPVGRPEHLNLKLVRRSLIMVPSSIDAIRIVEGAISVGRIKPGSKSHMSRSVGALIVAALLVITLGAVSADDKTKKKKDKEDSSGAVWDYKLTKDKKEETGVLQVTGTDVLIDGKKVGHVERKSPTETAIVFTDHEQLKGKATLTKTKMEPPVWDGKLVKSDGTEWRFHMDLKKR